MSNPLRLFRKYQYISLVAFGVMLMFAFVIGPILSDYLDNRMSVGTGANPVVVTWKGGELTEIDIDNVRTVHLLTTRFLRDLASQVRVTEERLLVLKSDVVVERKGENEAIELIKLIPERTYPVATKNVEDGIQVYSILVDGEIVKVPERQKDKNVPQVRLMQSQVPMISEASGEEELVQRILLANEAAKLGVVVGEDAVIDYLDNLCLVTPSTRPDYARLLSEATDGRLAWRRFVGQMAQELASQRMVVMAQGGLYAIPPDALYQAYNKLNRRISAQLLAVDVKSFLDKVSKPTENDILVTYEEGKNRYPIPTSPEPSFKQRKKIAFAYVLGKFEDFEQREVDQISPTITNEEIAEYYETNKETYKIVELPDAEPDADDKTDGMQEGAEVTPEAKTDPAQATTEPGKETPAKEEPAKEEPAKEEPAKEEPAKEEPAKEEPAKEEPAKEEPAKEEPAKEEPAKEEPAKEEPAKEEPAKEEPAKEEPAKEEPAKEGTDDQVSRQIETMTFVSYQDPPAQDPPAQDPPAQDPPALDPPAKTDPATSAQSGEATPPATAATAAETAQEQGTEAAKTEAAKTEAAKTEAAKTEAAKTEAAKTEAAKTEAAKTEAAKTEAAKTEAAADGTATTGDPAAKPAAAGTDETPAEKPAKYKPLDDELRAEIRETIARQRARDPAQEKLNAALDNVRGLVDKYARQSTRSAVLKTVEKPEPLDLDAITKANNLSHGVTPLWDVLDVSLIGQEDPTDSDPPAYELARAVQTNWSRNGGQSRRTFNDAFAGDLEKYVPRRLVDGMVMDDSAFPIPSQKQFLFWRVKEVPETTPRLIEIAQEVRRQDGKITPTRLTKSLSLENDDVAYEYLANLVARGWGAWEKKEEPEDGEKDYKREFQLKPLGSEALDEIRAQVIAAWKMQQALPLAQAEAERMAQQAREADKPLGDVFPNSADTVISTSQFSWMTRGSMPGGMGGRPMLSPVNGIANKLPVNVSGAGNDFMWSIFSLDVGQVGTATNEPHAFVYVVRIESEDLSEEDRREAFYAYATSSTGLTQEIYSLAQEDQAEIVRDWFLAIEEDYGVKWAREANNKWGNNNN